MTDTERIKELEAEVLKLSKENESLKAKIKARKNADFSNSKKK